MKSKLLCIIFLTLAVCLSGCEESVRIDTVNDEAKDVVDLDYRDFDLVAGQMTQSMLASGILKNNPVVSTGQILNLTTRRIDTPALIAKIEEEIINSGLASVTSAVGGRGSVDSMVHDIREVRESDYADEFKEGTIAGKGNLIAPSYNISGRIFHREVEFYNQKTQYEYYFQLMVTDISSGLRVWQKEVLVGKRG